MVSLFYGFVILVFISFSFCFRDVSFLEFYRVRLGFTFIVVSVGGRVCVCVCMDVFLWGECLYSSVDLFLDECVNVRFYMCGCVFLC